MDQPQAKVVTIFDQNSIYIGEVQNNAKNGLGIQIYHDGTIYTGTFANNVFDGNGAVFQNKKQELGQFSQGNMYQSSNGKLLATDKQVKWGNEFIKYINNDNVSEFKQIFNKNTYVLNSLLCKQQQQQQYQTQQLQNQLYNQSVNEINIKEQINKNITILQQQRDLATQNCIDYENRLTEMLENEKWYNTTIEQLIAKCEELQKQTENLKTDYRNVKDELSQNIKKQSIINSKNLNTPSQPQSEGSKCNIVQPAGWCDIKHPNGNILKGQLNNNILTDLRLQFANRDGLKLNVAASINLNNDFLTKINNEELQMNHLSEEEQKTALKLLHKNQVIENICEISFPNGNVLRGELDNQKVKNAVLTFVNGDVIPIIGEINIEQELIQRVNNNKFLDVSLIKDEIENDTVKYIIYKDQNGEIANEQQATHTNQTNENKLDQIDQKAEILIQTQENADNTCLIAFSNGKSIIGQLQQNSIVNPTITSENGEQTHLQQSIEIQSELFNLLNQSDTLDLSKLSEEQKFKVQNDNIDCSVVFPNGNTLSGKLRECHFENPLLTFKSNQVIFINENVKILNETVLKFVKSEQREDNQANNNDNHTQQQGHIDNQHQEQQQQQHAPKTEDNVSNQNNTNQNNLDSNQFNQVSKQQNNTQNPINIPNTNGPFQNKTDSGVGTENDKTNVANQKEDESQNQNGLVKIPNEQNQTNKQSQEQNDEQTTQNDNSGTVPTETEPRDKDAPQSSNIEKSIIGSENTNQQILNCSQTAQTNNSDVTAQNNQNITTQSNNSGNEIDAEKNNSSENSLNIDSESENPASQSENDDSQQNTLENVTTQHLEGQKDNSDPKKDIKVQQTNNPINLSDKVLSDQIIQQHLQGQKDNAQILIEEPREQNPTNIKKTPINKENDQTTSNQVPQQTVQRGAVTQNVVVSQNAHSEETGKQSSESSSESIEISSDSKEEENSKTNKEQQNENENKVEEEKENNENEEQQEGDKEDAKKDNSKQQDANVNQSKGKENSDKDGKVEGQNEINVYKNANMTQADKEDAQNIQNTEEQKVSDQNDANDGQHNIAQNTNTKQVQSTDEKSAVQKQPESQDNQNSQLEVIQVVGNQNPANDEEINSSDIEMGETSSSEEK
ncbi:MORN_motif [Hexamita inflata]|uniref:MORN motif n=1 Tax=Hexamita inflata TaxID=28002 RepID=A0AA86N9T0_9EUKA|nr:MORN motif [Hexamita inflata]